jgi:hypothetical protein
VLDTSVDAIVVSLSKSTSSRIASICTADAKSIVAELTDLILAIVERRNCKRSSA